MRAGPAFGRALLLAGLAGPASAADLPPAAPTLRIDRGGERLASLTAAALDALPSVKVTASFGNGHAGPPASFEGPLLWTVLTEAHALAFAKPSEQVRQVVLLTGSDGYTAVLALGELAPDFEGKQVIVADRMDGKPLGLDHLRVVVPGDGKAGRSVRDVVSIGIVPLPRD